MIANDVVIMAAFFCGALRLTVPYLDLIDIIDLANPINHYKGTRFELIDSIICDDDIDKLREVLASETPDNDKESDIAAILDRLSQMSGSAAYFYLVCLLMLLAILWKFNKKVYRMLYLYIVYNYWSDRFRIVKEST